jgi:general secretion pathway protein J
MLVPRIGIRMNMMRQSSHDVIMTSRGVLQQGFTLLELLIAMTLLVLIVTITMGALRFASRSVAAGERTTENQERFRTVTAILDAQIQSQMPLTYEEEGNKAYYFRGASKALRLATNYSIWGGARGYVIVNYRVDAANGKQTLYASEHAPGVEGTREAGLFINASEIFFEYYQREPNADAGTWVEEWSDEMAIPDKIRLHVAYGTRKFLFQFPLRAKGKTVLVAMKPLPAAGGPK